MPCKHKFQSYLKLERIDFEPTTLIVGTFNPEWPVGNTAHWFYGRTHDEYGNQNNNFWAVLPRLYGEASLINTEPVEWKRFCRRHNIAITDIISSVDDADPNNQSHVEVLKSYSDEAIEETFLDFEMVNIVRILRKHPTIANIYLTRTISQRFWRNYLFPLIRYCEMHNKIKLKSVITPSGFAFREHGRHNRQNPTQHIATLEDYILMRWKEEWHFQL